MAEASSRDAVVPMSQAPRVGQRDSSCSGREVAGATGGTAGLKALARRVLAGDTRRNSERDKMSHDRRTTAPQVRQADSLSPAAHRQDAETSAAVPWGKTAEQGASIIKHDGKIQRTWGEGIARLDRTIPATRRTTEAVADIHRRR